MTSVMGSIRALIKTHLEVTSLIYAENSDDASCSSHPFAMFQIYDAEESFDVSNVLDARQQLEVTIIGSSIEQVDLAIEEVVMLWKDRARMQALLNIGVIDMAPTGHTHPIAKRGDNRFVGYVNFEFTVRYDYT